ncbi:hypothetical protein [Rhizobium leguminosarum]|uniref:hypothetical protein n=1 Tax=Rhizobium leguminosarum TaxID=384 RepID=UPI00124AE04E|nr:hypothetical protein [Rhizobium leguminosarum]
MSPSLVIGGRSVNLVIAPLDISVNSAVSQVESEAMPSGEGLSKVHGGSSSIIEAISIRASGSWRISGAIHCPHQSLCGGGSVR